MAAYSYKEVTHREDFNAAIGPAMKAHWMEESEFDGNSNYDGHCWLVAAYLLDQKDAEIERLKAEIRTLTAR